MNTSFSENSSNHGIIRIEELKHGNCILVNQEGEIVFYKQFPTYNLASHFLSYYSAENDIEKSYKEWSKIFFRDNIVSEQTFKHDNHVISILENFFLTLDDTEAVTITDTDREIAKIGACSFVTYCLNNGFVIKRIDEN